MTALATWKHRGTLYVEGNSTAETTTDATPRKLGGPTWSKSGESGLTVDTTGGDITIDTAGDYLVAGSVSFSGTASKTFNLTVYIDAASSNISLERKLGAGGDVGSASIGPAVLTMAAGEELSIYHSSTDGGSAFTATDMQLTAVRLS